MIKYKKLDEKVWFDFGNQLIRDKGSDKQIEFLQACREGKNSFLGYLDKHLFNQENSCIEGKITDFKHKFSEREFRYPPPDTQQIIWDTFQELPHEVKKDCGFWGYIVIDLIKSDCIKPDYLASNVNGSQKTGIYELDIALESDDIKKTDECVRRILRSMSNKAPRGLRIIFKDFYLGKSYWRWHWSQQMSKLLDLKREEILSIFDETSYGHFSAKMHSGKSYISQANILGGLLLFLANNSIKKKLVKIIDKISFLSVWKALEMQSPQQNQQEIQIIADSI